MILIADSGSTKTEWCVVNNNSSIRQITTAGTNPFFQSAEEITGELEKSLFPTIKGYPITKAFFYGAGCAFPKQQQIISDIISLRLQVQTEVNSDLMGAARAICKTNPGIACILGTGSNSCLYNGKEVIQQTPPLGYILGDEGSGAVLGKLFIGDCLKKQLPDNLVNRFMEQYGLTQAILLERVYKQPFPNRFLASLTPFLLENISEEPIYNLVYNSFRDFFRRNILNYKNAEKYPVGFIGSIAYYFREVLQKAALAERLHIGAVSQSPMEGLIEFHKQ